jgi:hypothetical protein
LASMSSVMEGCEGQAGLPPALAYDPLPPVEEMRTSGRMPSGLHGDGRWCLSGGRKLPRSSLSTGSFILSGTYS